MTMMDEKDCLMLCYIAEEHSLKRAADRLYITQPALTYRLNQMEKEFGVPIIVRGNRGTKLTMEGERLAQYAKRNLRELTELKEAVIHLSGEVKGTLRLGISSYYGHYRLPPILKSFKDIYPDVQFSVTCGLSAEIYEMLRGDEIHLGVIRNDYPWSEGKHLLHEEHICVISKEAVALEQLPELPLIRYKDPGKPQFSGHMYSSFNESVQAWWSERFGRAPRVSMEVDSYETCKEMVRHGLGYSIVPEIFVSPKDELYAFHLIRQNGDPVLRRTWMLYKNKSSRLMAVERFVEWMLQT
ncbi:LysR family transcriptional regulator [Paenibacillus kribbensis]|uniref:LysR family transcriptional regulator n=1 Tax=Paenibacillus kribbensis TaxID=172713 RepID=UPI0009FC706C|nr:LysR family transcriptional regulator [Paenibacillus kribbensis]